MTDNIQVDLDEVIAYGKSDATINGAGNIYIPMGRKYVGKKIRFFILDD